MATRAKQFDFLLSGLRDPDDGEPLNGGSVEFYVVGTSTPKSVWTEADKTNDYTSYTLDTNGVAELYGDGNYKVVVKDSTGATEYTFDMVKTESVEFIVRRVSSATVAVGPDDDMIIADTSSNSITLNFADIATFSRPVTVVKDHASNSITLDPYDTQQIGGNPTVTMTVYGDVTTLVPDNDSGEWKQYNHLAHGIIDGSQTLASVTTTGDVTVGDEIVMSAVDGTIRRGGATGYVHIRGGSSTTDGAEVLFYGNSHASAGIIDFKTAPGGAQQTDLRIEQDGDLIAYYDVTVNGALNAAGTFEIGGTQVTASAAEINSVCEGNTATAVEIVKAAGGIGVTLPRPLVVQIGDWAMSGNTQKLISYATLGVDYEDIIGVSVWVREDGDSNRYPIDHSVGGTPVGAVYLSSSLGLRITHDDTFFTGGTWTATSYNRGWVILEYLD
jgi:hypothetical protein